jgi:hypothetical protein
MSDRFSIDEFLASKLSEAANEVDVAAVNATEFRIFAQSLRTLVGELRSSVTELTQARELAQAVSVLSDGSATASTIESKSEHGHSSPRIGVPPQGQGESLAHTQQQPLRTRSAQAYGVESPIGSGFAEASRERRQNASVASGLGRFGQAFAVGSGTIGRDSDGVLRLRDNAHAAAGAFRALGSTADAAFGAIGSAVGKALADFANYSKAQEQISGAHKETAEESAAAMAAQVQAVLGGIAQQSGVKAVFEAAEALAAYATYRPVEGTQHAAAAAMYGSIAVGTAVTGHAIGSARGNTRQENEMLASSRGGSARSGGEVGGGGDGGPGVINIYTGQQILATRTEIERELARGVREAQRRR